MNILLELKLGQMSTQELAEWSGRTVAYITKNKKKWCANNLAEYADYELYHGGVNILKIKNPIFASSGLQEVRDKYRKYWGYNNMPIDTNTKCWIKLSSEMVNEIKFETGRRYVGQCRREDYGVARKHNKYDGSKGHCNYIFCKSIQDQPVLFTEEELKIKAELSKKYLRSNEEEEMERQALTRDYKRGDITQEEYAEAMAELVSTNRGWIEFQTALEEAIGCSTDFFIEVVDDAIKQ